MHLIAILLLAISSNLDNLGVAIAYGTRKMKLPVASNLLIALITSTGTLLATFTGRYTAVHYLSAAFAGYLGAGIIIAVGFYLVCQACRNSGAAMGNSLTDPQNGKPTYLLNIRLQYIDILVEIMHDPVQVDRDYSGSVELKEAAALALALTMNNLANAFGAGVSGLSPGLLTAAVFVFSLLIFWGGIEIGVRYTSHWLGDKAGLAAGLMLMAIGIYELFV